MKKTFVLFNSLPQQPFLEGNIDRKNTKLLQHMLARKLQESGAEAVPLSKIALKPANNEEVREALYEFNLKVPISAIVRVVHLNTLDSPTLYMNFNFNNIALHKELVAALPCLKKETVFPHALMGNIVQLIHEVLFEGFLSEKKLRMHPNFYSIYSKVEPLLTEEHNLFIQRHSPKKPTKKPKDNIANHQPTKRQTMKWVENLVYNSNLPQQFRLSLAEFSEEIVAIFCNPNLQKVRDTVYHFNKEFVKAVEEYRYSLGKSLSEIFFENVRKLTFNSEIDRETRDFMRNNEHTLIQYLKIYFNEEPSPRLLLPIFFVPSQAIPSKSILQFSPIRAIKAGDLHISTNCTSGSLSFSELENIVIALAKSLTKEGGRD
ncbi:MAG: hypothetical protein N3G22_02600 [Candidatus Micrarchaeota archaeon]|nr:hypothetical protein [Candidatus Micrarchaeota archaeon]